MQCHIEQAAAAGASEPEVLEAVEVGIEMSGGPGTVSARFALEVMDSVYPKVRMLVPESFGTRGYLILGGSPDESDSVCYYDLGTRRLSAARDCSDINQYCNSQAWCAWMGPDVGSCYLELRDLPAQICPPPDGGRD